MKLLLGRNAMTTTLRHELTHSFIELLGQGRQRVALEDQADSVLWAGAYSFVVMAARAARGAEGERA